jgi:hypothetical protein
VLGNMARLDRLNRIHAVEIKCSCRLAGESGMVFYCIAVGKRA